MTGFWWRADEPRLAEALYWPLSLASVFYRAGALLHRATARPLRASVPVISVGNLTVGGAGKTPVTLFLAEYLRARGRRPAVLSRGYGRSTRRALHVEPQMTAAQAGDEPLLLARRGLDVWVGPRRSLLAGDAVSKGADVLLLDDGLQHHALARDLDVIVADASNPLGNARLLPRGPLREPISALARGGLLWLTRCDLPRDPRTALLAGPPRVESAFVAREAGLRGKRVFLFAGIARPASFEATVRRLEAEIAGRRWFRDHHAFSAADLALVRREAAEASAEVLVTTEKDFVRLGSEAAGAPAIVPVPVDLKLLSGQDALDRALGKIL